MLARISILLLLFGAAAGTGLAQEGPLTKERVEAFLASMSDLEAWEQEHEDEVEAFDWEPESLEDLASPFVSATEVMESQPWAGEVREVVRKHGFDDLKSWAVAGDRIFKAYLAVAMDNVDKSKMDSGMAEALRDIEASDLPEEKKAELREVLGAANEMSKMHSEVPEADKQAVMPFLEQLEHMGEDDWGSDDED